MVELLEKVLKEIKYETELNGEVKWSGVGLRKGGLSRMLVEQHEQCQRRHLRNQNESHSVHPANYYKKVFES